MKFRVNNLRTYVVLNSRTFGCIFSFSCQTDLYRSCLLVSLFAPFLFIYFWCFFFFSSVLFFFIKHPCVLSVYTIHTGCICKPMNFLDSKQTNFLIMNDVMGLSFLTAFCLLDCLASSRRTTYAGAQKNTCEDENRASWERETEKDGGRSKERKTSMQCRGVLRDEKVYAW